jgi:phospholipid/cholesterol/gamma-HCH transport system substrate-binding protein
MDRKTIDLWVGIFLLIGFLALLFLALKVGNLGGQRNGETYNVEARFENIGGLKLGAPVKSAGVLVGRVTDIRLDKDTFRAVAKLSMDKRFPFPKDSSASILTSGLLGEVYIGLDAGGDDKTLAEGDRISLTQSAVVLERLIGQFLFNRAADGPETKASDKPAEKK